MISFWESVATVSVTFSQKGPSGPMYNYTTTVENDIEPANRTRTDGGADVQAYSVYCHCEDNATGTIADDALGAVFDCDACGRQFLVMNRSNLTEVRP